MHVVQGRTCLHYAIDGEYSNLVQLLLQHNSNVSATDHKVRFISIFPVPCRRHCVSFTPGHSQSAGPPLVSHQCTPTATAVCADALCCCVERNQGVLDATSQHTADVYNSSKAWLALPIALVVKCMMMQADTMNMACFRASHHYTLSP